METSAKTAMNVNEIFMAIGTAVCGAGAALSASTAAQEGPVSAGLVALMICHTGVMGHTLSVWGLKPCKGSLSLGW